MDVTFLIGLPGAGKSTYAPEGVKRVCPDEIRKKLYGDISVQGDPKKVFGRVYGEIRRSVKNGIPFTYDATNADIRSRRDITCHIRKCAAEYGKDVRINAVYLATPVDTCIMRNKGRKDRKVPVPEEIIRKMAEKLEAFPPVLEDGFDSLSLKQ